MNQTAAPQGNDSAQSQSNQATQPALALQAVYSKNSSFELGGLKQIEPKDWRPQMRVEMDSHENQLGKDLVEVVLKIRLTALQQEHTAYVVNHEQAGRFLLQNIPQNQLERLYKGQCVQTLYPYARESISNLITRAGFPPIYLQDVNFDAAYQAQKNQPDDNAKSTVAEKHSREASLT